MTKIVLSPLFTDLAGGVRNNIFASWKGRNYLKTKVTPAYTRTWKQANVRDSVNEVNIWWRSMYPLIKQAWAREGAIDNITGFNMWFKASRYDLEIHNPINLTPPVDGIENVSLVNPGSSGPIYPVVVNWTSVGIPAGSRVMLVVDSGYPRKLYYDPAWNVLASDDTITIKMGYYVTVVRCYIFTIDPTGALVSLSDFFVYDII